MNMNKRVQDPTQIFDRRWTVNQNKATKQVEERKQHFNRMFNIKDKTDQRKEMLYQNSVEGQVNALNDRINSMNQGNRINKMNNFRNGFK